MVNTAASQGQRMAPCSQPHDRTRSRMQQHAAGQAACNLPGMADGQVLQAMRCWSGAWLASTAPCRPRRQSPQLLQWAPAPPCSNMLADDQAWHVRSRDTTRYRHLDSSLAYLLASQAVKVAAVGTGLECGAPMAADCLAFEPAPEKRLSFESRMWSRSCPTSASWFCTTPARHRSGQCERVGPGAAGVQETMCAWLELDIWL